eukprot:COSAG05_NODE_1193_length_5569_cov_3.034552_6_plen_43_part_00
MYNSKAHQPFRVLRYREYLGSATVVLSIDMPVNSIIIELIVP